MRATIARPIDVGREVIHPVTVHGSVRDGRVEGRRLEQTDGAPGLEALGRHVLPVPTRVAAFATVVGPVSVAARRPSAPVKSGLIDSQWRPPSLVRSTIWAPRYRACRSTRSNTSGDVHVKRYFHPGSGCPKVDTGQGEMSCDWPVRRSKRCTTP